MDEWMDGRWVWCGVVGKGRIICVLGGTTLVLPCCRSLHHSIMSRGGGRGQCCRYCALTRSSHAGRGASSHNPPHTTPTRHEVSHPLLTHHPQTNTKTTRTTTGGGSQHRPRPGGPARLLPPHGGHGEQVRLHRCVRPLMTGATLSCIVSYIGGAGWGGWQQGGVVHSILF